MSKKKSNKKILIISAMVVMIPILFIVGMSLSKKVQFMIYEYEAKQHIKDLVNRGIVPEGYEIGDVNPYIIEREEEKRQLMLNESLVPKVGMTEEQVLSTKWGEPDSINRTTTEYGIKEQWVYTGYSKNKYVYLENGIVTTIQDYK